MTAIQNNARRKLACSNSVNSWPFPLQIYPSDLNKSFHHSHQPWPTASYASDCKCYREHRESGSRSPSLLLPPHTQHPVVSTRSPSTSVHETVTVAFHAEARGPACLMVAAHLSFHPGFNAQKPSVAGGCRSGQRRLAASLKGTLLMCVHRGTATLVTPQDGVVPTGSALCPLGGTSTPFSCVFFSKF